MDIKVRENQARQAVYIYSAQIGLTQQIVPNRE
jgi:hypothetical protein